MFANSGMGGGDIAIPDACRTPVPIPYPNFGTGLTFIPNNPNIIFVAGPAHNLVSFSPLTVGDQPGVLLGLISNTVMAQDRHILGSFTFLINAMPATRLTSLSLQNTFNMVGGRVIPSQLIIVDACP